MLKRKSVSAAKNRHSHHRSLHSNPPLSIKPKGDGDGDDHHHTRQVCLSPGRERRSQSELPFFWHRQIEVVYKSMSQTSVAHFQTKEMFLNLF